MSSIHRIALVGPNFFSYIEAIRKKMLDFGVYAEFFDERYTNTPIGKALYRLGIYKLFNWRRQQHLDNIAARIIKGEFTDVLLIDVEVVDRSFVKHLVDAGLRLHVYMWDSARNKPGYVQFLDLLNGKASFDPDDCSQLDLKYIPLFAEDVYSLDISKNNTNSLGITCDFSFCGTLHSNRAKIISDLEKFCQRKNLELSLLLYFHAKWMFLLKCFLVPSNFNFLIKVSSNSFSKERIAELFQKSRFVLDLHHPDQSGLTARTFEVLRSGARLVTFNTQVHSLLPTGLANRIIVIENISDLDQINFKGVPPLKSLTSEEDYYLSINRFVEDITKLIEGS